MVALIWLVSVSIVEKDNDSTSMYITSMSINSTDSTASKYIILVCTKILVKYHL